MSPNDRFSLDDPAKRTHLMQLLSCGALSLFPPGVTQAGWFSSSSKKLPADKSIYSLSGEVLVNGKPANVSTRIRGGDAVRTGDKSEILFAVGADSFLLHSNAEMEINGYDYFISSLRILTGRLLSVFGKRTTGQQLDMLASTATIGIRGTGVYIEVEPELTYLCTCYGQVALSANDDANDSELITTTRHDKPRYISNKPNKGTRIRKAPVINHTNTELKLLEALVGRKVPRRLRKTTGGY